MTIMTLTGNLTRDPELKTGKSGKPFASVSFVWQERIKDKSGQWVDSDSIVVQATCFDRVAENVAQSLRKGVRITATGRVNPEIWNSQKGPQMQLRMSADAVAVDMQFQQAQVSKPNKQGQQAQQDQQESQQDTWGGQGFGDSQADEPPF